MSDEIVAPDAEDGSGAAEQQPEQVTNLVLAKIDKIEQKIEHLHLPMAMPTGQQARSLKDNAPEVYATWLELAKTKAASDNALQHKPYDHPFVLAKRGQWFGLTAMVMVLGFCGYLASLGGAGIYFGGILGAADLVAIIATFMGSIAAAHRRTLPGEH